MRICFDETAPKAVEPIASRRYSPFAFERPTTGMAALRTVADVSSPSTLLKMTTAIAPLAKAKAALLENKPVPAATGDSGGVLTEPPRTIRAILPATESGTWSGVSATPQ